MANCTVQTEATYFLELDTPEAQYLRGLVQNYTSTANREEPPHHKKHRTAIFTALNTQVNVQGVKS